MAGLQPPSGTPDKKVQPGEAEAEPGGQASPDPLTRRETECLALAAHGLRDFEISARLDISRSTVRFHMRNVARKLHALNRTHAVYLGATAGWI